VLAPSPFPPAAGRAIILLAIAGFASQSMVRSADSLLPQISTDLAVTVGAASVIVSVYTLAHGSMQVFLGPFADRFNKYLMSIVVCALSAVTVAACGFATGLSSLVIARVASGLTASWIIPLGMSFIGDAVPYERRQQVLGRYLAGQITGQMFGQATGGIVGDLFGWRATFLVHAMIFAIVALALLREYVVNPTTRIGPERHQPLAAAFGGYRVVLAGDWSRLIIMTVFIEAALMFGTFAFIGADLHMRFGLGFTAIGAVVGTFAIGGLLYAASVKELVARLGQRGLTSIGGCVLGVGFLILAVMPQWWLAPAGVILIGLGFYMLHNTLQTHATQMSPNARGTAVGLFSCAFYFGQTAGVTLTSQVVDHAGTAPAFLVAAVLLPALGFWFSGRLRR
jgi:MFS transporter, YNFM family, putative membrane transport protein